MIDLHCHSTFSDGLHSPASLLMLAQEAGLKALSLTDHDTVDGVALLQEDARQKDITVIPGIELSTRWKKYDIHILGYQFNPHDSIIMNLIDKQNESRIARAQLIGERLASIGIEDAYDKACKLAGHKRIGRPHFAQLCVNEGLVNESQLAFKKFLGRGKAAYIPTPWISIQEAVSGIVDAGGQAVLAHPVKYDLTQTKLHSLIKEFKDAGGVGLEVVSGEIMPAQIQEMAGLCLRYDLLASSGSDFHGAKISRVLLGRQRQLPVNCTPIWHQWTI